MFKKILQKDLKKKAGLVDQISSKFIAHIVYNKLPQAILTQIIKRFRYSNAELKNLKRVLRDSVNKNGKLIEEGMQRIFSDVLAQKVSDDPVPSYGNNSSEQGSYDSNYGSGSDQTGAVQEHFRDSPSQQVESTQIQNQPTTNTTSTSTIPDLG